jgi:hypothetical protein
MPRIVVHLKKKKFGGNVTLAAGSFSLDLVQDRIDELTTAKETAIKVRSFLDMIVENCVQIRCPRYASHYRVSLSIIFACFLPIFLQNSVFLLQCYLCFYGRRS